MKPALRSDGPPVLQLESVTRAYGDGGSTVLALSDVSLELVQAEVVALVGPSGSGKTTLLQLAGAVDQPTDGRILHLGLDLATLAASELTVLRRRHIGFVFQLFNLIPGLDAEDNVALVARLDGVPRRIARDRACELLGQVGLFNRSKHLPRELSGGEQQRVAIARALVNNPRLILADEPTGSLDRSTGERIIDLLVETAANHAVAVLIVTHDDQLVSHTDRVLALEDGKLTPRSNAPMLVPRPS